MGANLAFWSVVTLVIRLLALIVLAHVGIIQWQQFKHESSLQPLKRILFYIPITIALTNIPQVFLSWSRIYGHTASAGLTSLATVSNALGVFLTSILLLLVYTYKGDNE